MSSEEDKRMTESRQKIWDAMMLSLGSYIEQEAKKKDDWREKTIGEIYAHLKHEIMEIGRSKSKTVQLHNAMDACSLSAILVAKLMEAEVSKEKAPV